MEPLSFSDMNNTNAPVDFPSRALWLWLPEENFPDRQLSPISFYTPHHGFTFTAALFSRTFQLEAPRRQLTALVAADCRFRIWLDGKYLCDGPPETGGDYACQSILPWAYFTVQELPEGLPSGEHLILAEVTNWSGLQSDYSMGHGGFRFALLDAGFPLLVSDGAWKCALDETSIQPGLTSFHEFKWKPQWHAPSVVPPEYTSRRKYLPCNLPPPAEQSVRPINVFAPFEPERMEDTAPFLAGKAPLRIRKGLPFTFYVEFADEIAGQLELKANCRGGLKIVMEPQEILGRGPVERDCRETIITQARELSFRGRNVQAIRYVRFTLDFGSIGLIGHEDFLLEDLTVHVRHFPLPPLASFQCSKPSWEAIRHTCRHTLTMCMQQMHWDSPVHQEGLGCVADYHCQAWQSYCLFGETRLARLDLQRIAKMLLASGAKFFHTSFALFYPMMLKEYLLHSADLELAREREIAQALNLVFDTFAGYLGPDGVVSEAPNYCFIDWTFWKTMTLHHPSASGGMAPMTAFYALALEADQAIAAYLGNQERANQRAKQLAALKTAFNRLFYDQPNERYINGIPGLTHTAPNPLMPPDPPEIIATPHAGILALAAGFGEPKIAEWILPSLMEQALAKKTQPYFNSFLFMALERTERLQDGFPHLMALWEELRSVHPDSFMESWDGGDFCHAWCGAPAIWLTRGVLGIRPITPGFKRFQVHPCPCGLTSFSGEMPTPDGTIRIQWSAAEHRLEIQHPSSTEPQVDTKYLPENTEVMIHPSQS